MNWKLVILAVGMSLTFWDIFNVPYIVNYSSSAFHVSQELASFPLSAEMVGYALGGAVNGLLASLRGRRLGLLTSMGLVSMGSLLGLLAVSFYWLIPAELLIGLGIEGELSIVPAYLSETSPPDRRGRNVGLVTASGFLTTLIVGPIAVLAGTGGWRLLFLAGLLVSIVALVLRLRLPESPMWASSKSRLTWDWGALIMLAVWFLSYFAGYSLFSEPIFSLLQEKEFSNSALYFTYILYGDPLGVLLGTFLNDWIERKVSSTMVNVIAGAVLILWPLLKGTSFLIAGFLEMYLQGFKFPVMYTYTAEVFGTRVRTLAYGIADGLGHLGGAVGPLLFSLVYYGDPLGGMALIGLASILAGVFIAVWGVRTTGRSLDQIRG